MDKLNPGTVALVSLALMMCVVTPARGQTGSGVASAQLQRLLSGNQRYVGNQARHVDQRPVGGTQTPFAAVVSCSDARVPPEILFDQGVNDLFVVRVAGNTVDDPASAHPAVSDTVQLQSLAYAVQTLGVKLIVVLGHAECGAVKGALQKCGDSAIGPMFQNICPAVSQTSKAEGHQRLDDAITANVRKQVGLLKSMSPFGDQVTKSDLRVVGAVYDIGSGRVTVVSP
jgi:carbonic anhydrase